LLSENADLELEVIGNIYENPELLEEERWGNHLFMLYIKAINL
jgi:hypothetical protein